MGNDSTTDAVVGSVTAEALEHFDKCMEQLYHEALITGSQRALATHQELKDFRYAVTGEEQD